MQSSAAEGDEITQMVFVENDSFRNLRRLPTDAFRSVPRLPREVLPVAASDLVAWYPFRAGTGEDITAGDSNFSDTTDYSATVNGATFQASGGVTDIKTGANSGAFDFDGSDDGITSDTQLPSDVHGSSSRTIMYWVKLPTVPSNPKHHVTLGNATTGESFGTFHDEVSGDSTLFFYAFGASIDFDTGEILTLNTYQHIAVTYDGSVVRTFVNGTETPTSGVSRSLTTPQGDVEIGQRQDIDISAFLDGLVDGVRVYNTALTQSQINQAYLNTEP